MLHLLVLGTLFFIKARFMNNTKIAKINKSKFVNPSSQ